MRTAKVSAIASVLPQGVLSNTELAAMYPGWSAQKIQDKTGIRERRIASNDQTAADLAVLAAERLFEREGDARERIDFLLFCTQTPDHVVPATACLLQARLGLRRSIGALDFSLGCSGFVYGLSLAKGLVDSGLARVVLLLTCDTYSKLIHPRDKSTRTLFGDAAAATLIEAVEAEQPLIGAFVFGTDGDGAKHLTVPAGGFRRPSNAASAEERCDASGNVRTDDTLCMDGAEVMAFTLRETPAAIARLLDLEGLSTDEVDLFVLHQANGFMLERLRRKLDVAPERFAVRLEGCGNTVSSSIPIALEPELDPPDTRCVVLAGFGAGYSWAATRLTLTPKSLFKEVA